MRKRHGRGADQGSNAEPDAVTRRLMRGFSFRRIRTAGAEINLAVTSAGPPLLLHGNPLTLVSWHRIALAMAQRYAVPTGHYPAEQRLDLIEPAFRAFFRGREPEPPAA